MSILVEQFRKSVAKLKDYRMKVETEFPVAYSTGFLNFDFTNGTLVHAKNPNTQQHYKYYSVGITDGSMVMVIGRSASGKTTWAIQSAANIIRPFKTSAIFHDDVEGGINETRKLKLSGFTENELQDRYVSRNTGITAENFYERVKMIHDMKLENREAYEYDTGIFDNNGNRIFKLEPTVYILDSLAMLMPEKFVTEDDLSGQMSATATAKTNAMIFKRVIPMLKAANIILFIVNHINQKVDINPMQRTKAQVSYLKQGETLPGGNAPIYLSNTIIRFDDSTKLKETEGFGFSGSLVDLTLVKSRTNKAGKSATLVFDQENGFDPDLSLLLLLKEAKRINGAGAYLYIDDHTEYKFSQKKFKEKLNTEPEFRNIFINVVLDVLKSSIDKDIEEIVEERETRTQVASMIMDQLNVVS